MPQSNRVNPTSKYLKRYTNLPATIDILERQSLQLLDPNSWDDRNDAISLEKYRRKEGKSKLLAVCFAQSVETYHHWRVFSEGFDGMCIEFIKDRIIQKISKDKSLIKGSVEYKTLDAIKREEISWERVPFTKRRAYRDEKEFRIIHLSDDGSKNSHPIKIDIEDINRVIISPWLPDTLLKSVKESIRRIPGCKKINIVQAKVISSQQWQDNLP